MSAVSTTGEAAISGSAQSSTAAAAGDFPSEQLNRNQNNSLAFPSQPLPPSNPASSFRHSSASSTNKRPFEIDSNSLNPPFKQVRHSIPATADSTSLHPSNSSFQTLSENATNLGGNRRSSHIGAVGTNSFYNFTSENPVNSAGPSVEGGNNSSNSNVMPRLSAQEWKDSTSNVWNASVAPAPPPHPAAALPTIASILSRLDSALPAPNLPIHKPTSYEYGNGAAVRGGKKPRPSGQASKPYIYAPRPGASKKLTVPAIAPADKPYSYVPQEDKLRGITKDKTDYRPKASSYSTHNHHTPLPPFIDENVGGSANGIDYSFANGGGSNLLPHMMMSPAPRPPTGPTESAYGWQPPVPVITNPFQTSSTLYPPSSSNAKAGPSTGPPPSGGIENSWKGAGDIPVGEWGWEAGMGTNSWANDSNDWTTNSTPPFITPAPSTAPPSQISFHALLKDSFSYHNSIYVSTPGAWFCKVCRYPVEVVQGAVGSFKQTAVLPNTVAHPSTVSIIRAHLEVCTMMDIPTRQALISQWGVVIDPSLIPGDGNGKKNGKKVDKKVAAKPRNSNSPSEGSPPPVLGIVRPKRSIVKPKRMLDDESTIPDNSPASGQGRSKDKSKSVSAEKVVPNFAAIAQSVRNGTAVEKPRISTPTPTPASIPLPAVVKPVVKPIALKVKMSREPPELRKPKIIIPPKKAKSTMTTRKKTVASDGSGSDEVTESDYEEGEDIPVQIFRQPPLKNSPYNLNMGATSSNTPALVGVDGEPVKKKKEKKRILAIQLDEFGEILVERRPTKFVGAEERYRDLYAMATPFRNAKNTTSKERARAVFVQNWLHYSYELSPGGNVCRPAMYKSYLKASSELGMENQINSASFGKAMRQAFPKIEVRRLGHRGNSTYHYTGIRPANTTEAHLIAMINRQDAPDADKTTANGNLKSSKKSIIDPIPGQIIPLEPPTSALPSVPNNYLSIEKPKSKAIAQVKKAEGVSLVSQQRQQLLEMNAAIKKSGRLSGVAIEEVDEEEEMLMGRMNKVRPIISLVGNIKRRNPVVIGKRKIINTAIKKKVKSFIPELGPIQNFAITIKSDPNAVLLIHYRATAEEIPAQLRPLSIVRSSSDLESSTCYLFHLDGDVDRAVDGLLSIQFTPFGRSTREQHILLSLGNGLLEAVVEGRKFHWKGTNAKMRILEQNELD